MGLAILAAAALLTSSTPAYAGEHWCEEDPVLTIDGRSVDYTVSIPLENVPGTTVHWAFHIPVNVVVASAITPPAAGSPAIPSTVRIYRDQPAYTLLSSAKVVTTVTYTATSSFKTVTQVWGTNTGWTTFNGVSSKALTFATGYSALPTIY
jgi:hypothetical protein